MKAISPKISDNAAEFYPSLFSNLHSGAIYTLEAFPRLYQRTLHSLKGRFSRGELMLMVDVMNATALTPGMAGHTLLANVPDGIALDHLDEKWEIDDPALNEKMAGLHPFEAACLEIWANGFWYREKAEGISSGEELGAWVGQLL